MGLERGLAVRAAEVSVGRIAFKKHVRPVLMIAVDSLGRLLANPVYLSKGSPISWLPLDSPLRQQVQASIFTVATFCSALTI
jgi:hypothetical protein